VVARSANGKRTAVSGFYGYQARFSSTSADITNLRLATEFQLNPRTLPELTAGSNEMQLRTAKSIRTELPVTAPQFERFAHSSANAEAITTQGQSLVRNTASGPATVTFLLEASGGSPVSGFDAGGRFLDLRDGLAPDKLTAEVRRVTPWPAADAPPPSASIAWSLNADGPWQTIWTYDPKLVWKDGEIIDRTLRWPEVDKQVRSLPPNTRRVFVRYTFASMAIDDFRLASLRSDLEPSSPLRVTNLWKENGTARRHTELIRAGQLSGAYRIDIPGGVTVDNDALILECPKQEERP
jgi:hypothetical protein